jgi:hypothetical protein
MISIQLIICRRCIEMPLAQLYLLYLTRLGHGTR